MKLSDWAKEQKLAYVTAYRWFKKGWLHALQMPNGTIIVDEKQNRGFKETKKNDSNT